VKEKFHFLLVPEDQEPIALESDDLEQLKVEAYKAMMQAGGGWAYFIIGGAKCTVSMPKQTFQLRMPNDELSELKDAAPPVFEGNGKFRVLVERPA
jgi:hypothetical protein